MKPENCEMRADMEEQEVEPSELFIDLGMLIVEGRVPGLTERGYGQGPHCPSAQPVQHAKHECNPQVLECQRQENFYKHMLLLYKNNIPMSVEVLLLPNCCFSKGEDNSSKCRGATAAMPEPNCVLLEQWTLQMIPTRMPDALLSARGLLQAVRSYLHFSQLSAWYSSYKGKKPKNVMYRICVPGETFSNKFNSVPQEHTFPLASAGKQNCIKISVKSLPRSDIIPEIHCFEHSHSKTSVNGSKLLNKTQNDLANRINNMSISSSTEPKMKRPRETIAQRIFALNNKSNKPLRTTEIKDKPADPMLGDSLLDPPHSLQMYHKRYQSPSRSGSPSLEAPEHLLSCSQKSVKRLYDEPLAMLECNESEIGPFREYEHKSRSRFKRSIVASIDGDDVMPGHSNLRCNWCVCGSDQSESSCEALNKQNIAQSHGEDTQRCQYEKSGRSHMFCDSMCRATRDETSDKWSRLKEKKKIFNQDNGVILHCDCQFRKPLSNLVTSEKPFYDEFSCKDRNPFNFRTKKEENVKYIYHPLKSDVDKRTVSVQTDESNFKEAVPNGLPHSKTWSMGLCHLPSNVPNYSLLEHEFLHEDVHSESPDCNRHVPSESQKAIFRRSLDSATSMVFHNRTSLPLTSSPAPSRKGRCFDFDSSLTSVRAIKRALFDKGNQEECQKSKSHILSSSAPASTTANSLLGNFEESVLNGRLEPVSTVEGFTAEIGASGSFCPNHITLPVTVFFYTFQDNDKITSPYLGHINLGKKGYHVPKKGTIQVTLFNPHRTVVKMFVVMYDFMNMPTNSQTFLRQRILYMPSTASENDEENQSWLRYLLHLRFCRSKSGKVYLHTDVRMVIFRKSDMDAATIHESKNSISYELRSFTHGPTNPKFSPIR